MLLNQEDIAEYTGYHQPAKQSAWLFECRIDHQYPNGKGKVAVTWEQVNNPRYKTEEPDFEKVA
jgi:hypothetical protein